jgi:integrase/recombinase XerD
MAKKDKNFATQNENPQFQEAIKKIAKTLRPLHLDYNQTKYIFKKVRSELEVRQEKKTSQTVDALPVRSVENLINTAYSFQTMSRRNWGILIKTLYLTGARVNEFVNIRVEDVFLQECKIKIREAKGGEHKARFVPILPQHRDELDTYIKFLSRQKGYLFESNRHKRYSTRRVEQIMEELSRICEIEAFPHKLRHSIAQYLYDNGMPLEQIQQFLGHSAIKTTQIYARSSIKHVQHGYNKAFSAPDRNQADADARLLLPDYDKIEKN